MKRLLSPATNPAGLTALIAALYALTQAILNARGHTGATWGIDPRVIVAALAACASLLTRQAVTPVKDPLDGNGQPLKTAYQHAAGNLTHVVADAVNTAVAQLEAPPAPAAPPVTATAAGIAPQMSSGVRPPAVSVPLGILTDAERAQLVGPKVNGNPERCTGHVLILHADADLLPGAPRDFDGLAAWLHAHAYEGIVWHHPDGRMAKIKKRDFEQKASTS